MKYIYMIIFGTTLFSTILSDPHYCCPNNGVLKKSECPDGSTSIIKTLCHNNSVFLIWPDEEFNSEKLKINSDDSLQLDDYSYQKDEYCIGKMMENKVEKEVALVCFIDTHNETAIGHFATTICCVVSILFIAVTLMVYIILPELRDLQGKCLMFSIFSLLMAFLFLASVQLKTDFSLYECIAMASMIYFWFLCVFFWLNVVSFNVWRGVICPKWLTGKQKLFYLYNVYAWGMPALLLTIALLCHYTDGNHIKPKFGITSCWFGGKLQVRLYFYGPISALLLLNTIMFISIAWTLWRNVSYKGQKHRSQKFKFLLYLKLFFIMGLCWIFEPLSDLIRSSAWIITDYVNALQGVLILLLLVVFRKRVRKGLARRGLFCGALPQTWVTIRDEECDELDEDVEEASSMNINTNGINETT